MDDRLSFEPVGGARVNWVSYLSYPMFQFLEVLVKRALVRKEIGASIGSVVMAVACAEAYVNELAQMELERDDESLRAFRKLKTDVVRKFIFLAQRKGAAFSSRADPLDSFKLLVGLRGLVVHFQVSEEPIETQETKLEKRLASKVELGIGDVWTVRVLTGACANWAFETSFGMLRHLYEIGYEPPSSAWFEAFRPGFRERMFSTTQEGTRKMRDI